MADRLEYREYAPSAALAGVVQCYWTISAHGAAPVGNRVLPDGCADILVDLAPRAGVAAHGRVDGRHVVAVGTMRRAIVVRLEGAVDLFGIRFRPAGAQPILGIPLDELTDRVVPLDDLSPGEGAELEAQVADAPDIAARIRRAEGLVLRRLAAARTPHPMVAAAVQLLQESRGRSPVGHLEQTLGVGGRQLERRFRGTVGVAPKQLARVVRLQHAIALLRRRPRPSWTQLALAAGYYDQAHLIREFKALAGITPRAYAAERAAVGIVQDGADAGP